MGSNKSTPARENMQSISERNSRVYAAQVIERERKLQQQKEDYEKLLKEQQTLHVQNLRMLKKNEEQKILILEHQLKLKDEKLQEEATGTQNREQLKERTNKTNDEYKTFVRPGGNPMRQNEGHFKQPDIYAGSRIIQEKPVEKEQAQNVNLRKELNSQEENEWVMVSKENRDGPSLGRKVENNAGMQNSYLQLANNLKEFCSLEKKKLSSSVNELHKLNLPNTSNWRAASSENLSDYEVATEKINRQANHYRNRRRYGRMQNVQPFQPAQENDNLQPTSDILGKISTLRETKDWKSNNLLICYVELSEESVEFKRISHKFHNTSRNQNFMIQQIVRIENPILLGKFILKKEEMRTLHGNVHVRELFHGTKDQFVNRICEHNLDWRCYKGKGVIYGNGVYFTPIAKFAADNCDKYSVNKVLLVCDVLTASACPGQPNMVIPPIYNTRNQLRHDTVYKDTTHRSGIVKFSDFEFYPKYLICFTAC